MSWYNVLQWYQQMTPMSFASLDPAKAAYCRREKSIAWSHPWGFAVFAPRRFFESLHDIRQLVGIEFTILTVKSNIGGACTKPYHFMVRLLDILRFFCTSSNDELLITWEEGNKNINSNIIITTIIIINNINNNNDDAHTFVCRKPLQTFLSALPKLVIWEYIMKLLGVPFIKMNR